MAENIWIHGNAVRAEDVGGAFPSSGPFLAVNDIPWTDVNGFPQGWGTTFHGKGRHNDRENRVWFHFPMPTVVGLAGRRRKVTAVRVLFETNRNAFSSKIHLWDGPNLFFTRERLEWSERLGARMQGPQQLINRLVGGQNEFLLTGNQQKLIDFGLGISIQIIFYQDGGSVTFAGAGAEFIEA